MTIQKFKNRRWDCDVSLQSGIPNTFPLFHGWKESRRKIVFGSKNFHTCFSCGEWVSDIDIDTHLCTKDYQDIEIIEPMEVEEENCFFEEDEEIVEEDLVYVITTDDNYEVQRCLLCQDLMKLEFLQEIDEWVFMDCVEYENSVLHKFCHDVMH